MSKPTAIRLSKKTVSIISDTLRIPEKNVEAELKDPTSCYYVANCVYMGIPMPYLIYGERSFLNDFASVPPGIDEAFVPVTQVK